MEILQEKFQVDNPMQGNDDGQTGWKPDHSVRVKKNLPSNPAVGFNSLPPGMDAEDQEVTDQRRFPMVMSGESDVSEDWSEKAMKRGFTPRPMRATDDEYSNQHNDAFYDEIEVDGVVGFVERNNVLDRL